MFVAAKQYDLVKRADDDQMAYHFCPSSISHKTYLERVVKELEILPTVVRPIIASYVASCYSNPPPAQLSSKGFMVLDGNKGEVFINNSDESRLVIYNTKTKKVRSVKTPIGFGNPNHLFREGTIYSVVYFQENNVKIGSYEDGETLHFTNGISFPDGQGIGYHLDTKSSLFVIQCAIGSFEIVNKRLVTQSRTPPDTSAILGMKLTGKDLVLLRKEDISVVGEKTTESKPAPWKGVEAGRFPQGTCSDTFFAFRTMNGLNVYTNPEPPEFRSEFLFTLQNLERSSSGFILEGDILMHYGLKGEKTIFTFFDLQARVLLSSFEFPQNHAEVVFHDGALFINLPGETVVRYQF